MKRWNLLPLDRAAIQEVRSKPCTSRFISCVSPEANITAIMLMAKTNVEGRPAIVVLDGALEPTKPSTRRYDLLHTMQEEWNTESSTSVAFANPYDWHISKALELLCFSPIYFASYSPIAAVAVEQLDEKTIGPAGNAVIQGMLYKLWKKDLDEGDSA